MTDFLDDKRQEITDRLKELKPLVDEYNRLEAAARPSPVSVGSAASAAASAVTRRRGPGRPRGRSQSERRQSSRRQRQRPPPQSHRKSQKRQTKAARAGRPAGQTSRRTAQRQRHARSRGAGIRAGTARHHDPRAGRQDGHQAELPLPRPARACEQENKVEKKGRGWYPKWLASSASALDQASRSRVVRLFRDVVRTQRRGLATARSSSVALAPLECSCTAVARAPPRSGPAPATVSRSLDQLGHRGVDPDA